MKIKQLVLLLGVLLTAAGCTTTKDKVSSNSSIPSAQKMDDISGQLKERITKVIDVRNGIAYLPNENELFTGKYETYYPNGQKETEVNYKDGKRNGLDTTWDENGEKISENNYIDGKQKTSEFHSFDYHGIEIKGIHIGMTEKDVTEKIGNVDGFTIAGVKSKFHLDPLNLHYHDGKLDKLAFYFTSEGFGAVLEAVKDKYPSLKCNNSTVSNAMGTSFQQMECRLEDSEAILSILRFVSDIETSVLGLTSQRWFDEQIKHRNDTKKDI